MVKLKKALAGILAAATIMTAVPPTAYAADLTGNDTVDSEESLLGDANLDGKANIRDAADIAKKLVDNEVNLLSENADCNGDGVINIRDAAIISRAIAAGFFDKNMNIKAVAEREKINKSQGNETIAVSSGAAMPGETVCVYVNVGCNDKFESADFTVTWDEALTVSSITGSGQSLASKIDGNSARITAFPMKFEGSADGTIVEIEFTVPADAEVGTVYNINFSQVNNFAIIDGPDIADSVNCEGGKIIVVDKQITNSLSLSSVVGAPGETVRLAVNGHFDGKLDYANLGLKWSDASLSASNIVESGNAVGEGLTSKKGYCIANVKRNIEDIADGKIADIEFTIPTDAKIGTEYKINWSDENTKINLIDDTVPIENYMVNKIGGTITVVQNYEKNDTKSELLSISSAEGHPGETVSLDISINDTVKMI